MAWTIGALALLPGDLRALPMTVVTGTASDVGEERSYPLPATDAVQVDRAAAVILVRSAGHAYAFALSCPHQNAAVKWYEGDHRFQCTKHDSKYQPDGVYTSGRATRNMDRFGIRLEQGALVVDLDRVYRSDQDPAGWAAATVAIG
ncbi:MAG: Rieske (2Fe-2S) protein [Vicinamibacterales bacterium]